MLFIKNQMVVGLLNKLYNFKKLLFFNNFKKINLLFFLIKVKSLKSPFNMKLIYIIINMMNKLVMAQEFKFKIINYH